MPVSTGPAMILRGSPDHVADRIRAAIEDGVLAPGEALNQVDLAASFGFSRIPIREALRRLEAEGYVSYQPNKGATVAGIGASEDVHEIIDIRECLEMQIMDHAVRAVTPAMLGQAEAALRALNRARTPDELRGAHERFHTILFVAADRPRTAAVINQWRLRSDRRPDVDGAGRRAYARATAGIHKGLLDACARRDRKAVARSVREEHDYMRSIASRLIAPGS
jgi:DNA-binding GntR family transcriptional regulator